MEYSEKFWVHFWTWEGRVEEEGGGLITPAQHENSFNY